MDKYLLVYRLVGEYDDNCIWFQPEFYDKALVEHAYLKGIPEVYYDIELYEVKKVL